uniref:Uncharacterized protein n=1 Tax=Rhizophora mucronata TaxID=61149 RepID=A0A2P2QDV0_RHIMU
MKHKMLIMLFTAFLSKLILLFYSYSPPFDIICMILVDSIPTSYWRFLTNIEKF